MSEPQKLEKYKAFPIIAWSTIIAFALIVYSITVKLKAVSTDLRVATENLEHAASGDILDQDLDNIR